MESILDTLKTSSWRLRCRTCNLTRPTDWVALLTLRSGPYCAECGSDQVTAQEPTTGAAFAFPRPLVPALELSACCNCGGGGLDAYGDTCPHCNGYGNCSPATN
ncbi:hypothetical protein [Actinomadura sp. 6N118]|uniref:hypothetical protein n=1 Tax=Actinomadura sp. 6N118 TaxID=3375151 RepID=UPI0037ABCED8